MWYDVFNDPLLKVFFFVVILDFGLGVLAGVKAGNFQVGKLPKTLRDDLLLKGLPLVVLTLGAKVAGETDLVIPGLDLEALAKSVFGLTMAGLGVSLLGSVSELYPGMPIPGRAGTDETGTPPVANPVEGGDQTG